MTEGKLIGAYIFGSVGRGQQDHLSDLDVLAVVKNGTGRISDSVIAATIPDHLRSLKLSIAWYGDERVRKMFAHGELFAWHLYMENIPIVDPHRFLAGLGRPSEYREFGADVSSFRKIMIGIPIQLSLNENNAVYEAGLLYVCLRNIAMSASWIFCERPNFSRYSPFNLSRFSQCPISVEDYETTMACRLAGQRGAPPPSGVNRDFVSGLFDKLEPWLDQLTVAIKEAAHE
jgi:hypothetical protein